MKDQSCNNKMLFLGCVVISHLYLFQEIVHLNPCFMFCKNLMPSFIDKVTTGTLSLVLLLLNVAPVVNPSRRCAIDGLAAGLARN